MGVPKQRTKNWAEVIKMVDFGAGMLHTDTGKLRDQLANGMPKSHMGNPGLSKCQQVNPNR
jgi:hypothetical protein